MITRREALGTLAASAVASALASPAPAQTAPWPQRFVRLVVPFTSGGGIDTIGRIVGARLSEIWGQQIVVENKPGAGGNIASEFVARAEPDGHTLYITAGGLAVNKFLFEKIGYDPIADFAPVTLICLYPNLMVVPAGSPFTKPSATSSPLQKPIRASSPSARRAMAARRTWRASCSSISLASTSPTCPIAARRPR